MFGRRQSAVQQLIESAQLDSPVDIPSLLRGSYDDELDLDDSVDTGSELLTPSSLGEGSEGGTKKRAARRHPTQSRAAGWARRVCSCAPRRP